VIHRSKTVLIILDMLNSFEFPVGRKLLPHALKAARRIAALKERVHLHKIPIIYVNDNLRQWRSSWAAIFEKCTSDQALGREIAEKLRPEDDEYFILKPKNSAFYSTCLDVLLREMGAKNLIVTGIAADICVLFSVHDAHLRDYGITVPRDCVASETQVLKENAIQLMKKVFKVNTPLARSVKI
jgi:nicotinamidase-related amidase